MNPPSAFPLAWPPGLPRTEKRVASPFRVGMDRAVVDLLDGLRLFGMDTDRPVRDVVISSNVSLGVTRPADPGVAIYFTWDGAPRAIAVDRFPTPEANLRAIFMIIEGRRQELRYGGFSLVRASFAGFKSLLGPPGERPWWTVLGLRPDAPADEIEARYRALAREAHPDRDGGSSERMAEINAAVAAARKGRAA